MLEAECQRNVEVLWLLGKLAPDFKTIADFRKDHLPPLQAVARQFTRWFGDTHFLTKGLAKVQCEWSLTKLTYNLKRVLNLVSFQKLMAVVS